MWGYFFILNHSGETIELMMKKTRTTRQSIQSKLFTITAWKHKAHFRKTYVFKYKFSALFLDELLIFALKHNIGNEDNYYI